MEASRSLATVYVHQQLQTTVNKRVIESQSTTRESARILVCEGRNSRPGLAKKRIPFLTESPNDHF
jgi:hypothetical protein